jgi:dynein heavy chain
MGHTRDVRKTRYVRRALLAPLRAAVALLKKHGAGIEELPRLAGAPVGEWLEQAELRLEGCVNAAYAKKEAIFALQTAEADVIKARAAAFEDSVRAFWNGFRRAAPFAFGGPPDAAYAALDGFYAALAALERGARELNEAEELFELPLSRFAEVPQCRAQLRLRRHQPGPGAFGDS